LHDLRRVIVVLPFTSIIDQTAAIFRDILGDAVLEHHSNLDPEKESLLNREASENWDSPVIVTTAVQFFESLFACNKRDCRKLHRIARSVIVLDEVQTLPLHLQSPIQYALDTLTRYYGSTVVHCSATQTNLIAPQSTAIVDPIKIREIFPAISRRVRVEWDIDQEVDVEALAAKLQSNSSTQALVIVETRRDAYQLARRLGHPWLHLSATMCAKHRRNVINGIKDRLLNNQTCLVISTQLVEAGVDLDFPLVYRALAGFDTLAQAAGRCNREGRLKEGVLRVFRPTTEPPGISLTQRRRCADSILKQGRINLFDPDLYPEFFRRLSNFFKSDERGVMAFELNSDFPAVSERFKMIDDEFSIPVIAPYSDSRDRVERLRSHEPNRESLRALQPYIVNLRPPDIHKLRSSGALEPLFPFQADETRIWSVLPAQKSCYDAQFGFVISSSVLLV
jgi:CRISPR-associated endonuclease/helicase Cas3